MKKLFYLLLFVTSSMLAQVSTGRETKFSQGIRNQSSQTVTNPNMLVTEGADGTYGKVSVNNVPISLATLDSLSKKQNLATGFAQGLALSINADPTKFNIDPGFYIITSYPPSGQPVVKVIQYAGSTGNTTPYLNSSPSTYVGINASGGLEMQTSQFTNTQRRTICILGNIVHSNLTNINVVNEIKAPIIAPVNQLHDLIRAIGAFNIRGNVFGSNGANMKLDKTAGEAFALGINAQDYTNPHVLSLGAQTALTFRYRNQNSSEGSDITDIDPNTYDNAGTTTAVPTNKFTIQRINLFQSGAVRIQRGQNIYNSLAEALAGFPTASFVTEPNIAENSIFRSYLVIRQGVTNINTAISGGLAQFVAVDKFGNTVSGGSIALTNANIIAALGFTPEDVGNKSDSYTVSSSTTYASTKALVDGLATKVGGSGTTNYVPIFTSSNSIGNSIAYFDTDGLIIKEPNVFGYSSFSLKNNDNTATVQFGVYNTANANANKSFIFASGATSELGFYVGSIKRMTILDNGNILVNTTSDNGHKFRVNGTSWFDNTIHLSTAPTTATGTPPLLTWNSTTKAVESVPYATFSGNFVDLTTNQTVAGVKTFSNTGSSGVINGLIFNNNGTASARSIQLANTSTGIGYFSNNTSSGTANWVQNGGSGIGIYVENQGSTSGHGIVSQGNFGATGFVFLGRDAGGINTFSVTRTGITTVASLISNGTIRLKSYTVATLPTGTQGDTAYVTDAVSPTYLGTLTGGGSVVCPVFYNGTTWVSH